MQSSFMTGFYGNLWSSAISLVVILMIYVIANFLVIRKLDDPRKKRNFRIRSFYGVVVVLLFIMAHVWVNGFTHLLAVLGLVSAGLVVTNKEIIMNLVGWLVITWRGLFAEDDLIQIQQYKGYVKRIGVLYITLYEVSDVGGIMTGRVIRVPNGLTANNALINFMQSPHLLVQQITFDVSGENDFDYLKQHVKERVESTLSALFADKKDYFGKRDKVFFGHARLEVKVMVAPKLDKLSTVQLIIRYYCASRDAERVREQILLALLKSVKNDQSILLAE